jgi:hypothetical protein
MAALVTPSPDWSPAAWSRSARGATLATRGDSYARKGVDEVRAVHWAQAASERADVEVSLAFTQPEEDPRELEAKTVDLLPQEHLRNKAVLRKLTNGQMR